MSASMRESQWPALSETPTAIVALRRILASPHGCRFCDSGKLRTPNNPAKDHDDDCGFALAAKVMAAPEGTRP